MKKLLLIALAFVSLCASAQKTCDVVADYSCPYANYGSLYLVVPQTFVQRYQHYRSGVNIINAVQTCSGCWVVSANAINDFPDLFSKTYNNDQLNANTVYLTLCNFEPCAAGTVTLTISGSKEKPVYPENRVPEPIKTFAIVRK